MSDTIAIIGSGMAACGAMSYLRSTAAKCTIFDKARGPGGRCSTRRAEPYAFDHGAQYFTCRDPRFEQQVAAWSDAGVAAKWSPTYSDAQQQSRQAVRRDDLWVGVPGMSAIAKHCLADRDVRYASTVARIEAHHDRYAIIDDRGRALGIVDRALVTVPAPQLGAIVAGVFPDAVAIAEKVTMHPCWTLMLAFTQHVPLPFDAARFDHSGVVGWLSRDQSKPGRPSASHDCWVIQATHSWSQAHLERSAEWISKQLYASFAKIAQRYDEKLYDPVYSATHRWRYALATEQPGRPYLKHANGRLAIAGDWLTESRIESAWLSGRAAAEAIV